MICILMATLLEADPFIKGYRLEKETGSHIPVFAGDQLALAICGIGKVNAAMSATYACLKLKPDVVCNIGAAGATDGSCEEGKIYQIGEVLDYNRPHFKSGRPHAFSPETLPGFETATLATRDRAVLEPNDRQTMAEFARMIDMEGSAVVQVCRKFQVPCYLFKQVTDTPEHTTDKDIVSNIRKYRDQLFEFYRDSISGSLESAGFFAK